jgi:tRNA A37 threonylcarbamoyladenosine modification protein TsaB
MSLLLGIETSSLRYAIVFGSGDRVLFDSGDEGEPPPDLAGLVERGLRVIGARAPDIAVIAINIGPGGLGAVRAGVSFANALAYGLGRPVCPFTAFELIGFEAWRKARAPILCIRSTSHGNAYVGLYDGVAVTAMRYGQLAPTVAEIAGSIGRLGVAGTSRNRITEILPRATVVDTGVERATARTFIDIGCAGRACLDPATNRVSPLNEQSRIFHEPG